MPEPAATGAPSDERTSLLDGLIAKVSETAVTTLARVVVCGSLSPGTSAQTLATWHEKRIASLPYDEPASGLLLALPTGWVELLEGPVAAVTAVLRAMEAEGGLVGVAKVIAAMEDVPARTFAAWSFKALDVGGGKFVELGPEGPAAILGDTVIGLLKVGKVVGAMERAAAAATLDNWSAEFGADVVPSNERVQQIIDNEDVPSLSDFLSVYDAKANVELKSARVWPPDAPMRY